MNTKTEKNITRLHSRFISEWMKEILLLPVLFLCPLCQYTNRHFSAFKPYLPSHQSVITEIDFPWSILDFESSFKVVLES